MALCLAALCASAQSYEVRTLTFEDADYRGSGNVVGEMNWSSLIDNPEYNGSLLYGDGASTYMWYDEGNTELVWDGFEDSGMGQAFWSGGSAISNYYAEEFSQADYTRQLSIPLATSTNQFIVVFSSENLKGYPSWSQCSPFYFADDKARIIESVDVINTAYALNSLTNGDGFAPAATDASQFVVHFEGTHEDGTTSEVTFLLADGRNFVTEWTTVDLTPLGEVKSLRTYVTGSTDLEGDFGLNTPGYVALDNIKVRFESEAVMTVEVTMNAKSKLIKSLVNMATNESVEVGEPTSNKYTFDVAAGSYLLTATASDGETVSGTIQLDVDADHTAFSIYSPEVRVKNTGWVYGIDYTFNLNVTDKEGNTVNTTIGDYTSGNKMFMVFNGNTYYLDVVPSDEHLAEGYLPITYSGTVTFNPTIQAEVPMSAAYSVTVPAEATFFLGTKTAHFVKFKEVAPESVTTEGAEKVYTFTLADKQVYNYRVSQEGKLTLGGLFTMSVDETKRPTLAFTEADMEAKDPKFIDHDVNSNSKYNVGDLFLNINPAGHLKLANVGDTYDILPMRNWQLIESITNNYFIDPDFHFTVVNLNGQEDNSVVKVEDELLTAVGTGTAIVLVTYDAIHLDQYSGATRKDFVGGSDWGAIWPENTGVFVVTVGEEASGITPNIIINKDYLTTVTSGGNQVDTKLAMENVDAEFDVLYYLDTEEGFDYTFTPEGVASVTLARPVIGANAASYTGFSAEGVTANADGSYTVRLTMGRNIVCLTDAGGKSVYQVMTAKPCHRDVMVGDEVVTSVKPGDAVTVQYSGLYHPANKLAGIHNFNAYVAYKQASDGITVKNGKGNQYTMAATATAQAVTFTVPDDWQTPTIELTDGVMCIGGFGDPVGNHRATSKTTGRAPNFTAISQSASLGRVPALSLPVELPVVTPDVATFEDITDITEPVDGHMSVGTEDDDDREFFTSGDYAFASGCMSDWDYWYWFGYASRTETKYETLDDQWNNIVGGGYDGSATYGVAFAAEFNGPSEVTLLTEPAVVPGFYITNSSYAYTSMLNGDGFAKKFEKGDWFKLTITGYDAANEVTGTKEYYLADLRDAKKAYIINDWRYVDLSCLGKVAKIAFSLSSSDSGAYGMNTPGYFCFDNFGAEGTEVLPDKNVTLPLEIATFEDIEVPADGHMSVSTEDDDDRTEFVSGDFEFATGCMSGWDYWYWFGYASRTEAKYETLDDQWNNIVGGGFDGSANYGIAFTAEFNGPCYVTLLTDPAVVPGFYITNSSYAYNSLTGGDPYAKKFEKGDWFKLTITGYDADDQVTGTKDYYLADLRDEATAYIINDWRYVDLSCLGTVAKIGFSLSSTDNGEWGMNTPAFFCFDNFGAEGTEVLPENNVAFVSSIGYATYVTKQDVDFSKSSVEAFAVTESSHEGYVIPSPVTEVPAGEAVLLKGEEGAYVLPAALTAPAAPAGNLLKPALADVTADGSQYILADGSKGIGFYKAIAGSTIAAGKGYLEFTGSPVKAFLFEGDDATGLSDMSDLSVQSDAIYNVAGQRIQKMQRGINIINGKKILR